MDRKRGLISDVEPKKKTRSIIGGTIDIGVPLSTIFQELWAKGILKPVGRLFPVTMGASYSNFCLYHQ